MDSSCFLTKIVLKMRKERGKMDKKMAEALKRINECNDMNSVRAVIGDLIIEDSFAMQKAYNDDNDSECIEYSDGLKIWRDKDWKIHRKNGPAIEYTWGTQCWYKHGKNHRLDGPAIIVPQGKDTVKHWYIDGEELTEQEHKRLAASYTGPDDFFKG